MNDYIITGRDSYRQAYEARHIEVARRLHELIPTGAPPSRGETAAGQ